jgi:8-oxo-dGTP pyrophosphatase MutT (NUDIX family)
MQRLTHGLSAADAQQQLGGGLGEELCLGHWVAAVRELFEEAGIYLFVSQGAPTNGSGSRELSLRLAEKRAALQDGRVEFSSLLTAENLCCDLSRLVYFFHRITPEHYPVRFDTRFYLAALPPQQTPLDSSEEVSESLWISAAMALERLQSGTFPMMPPTVAVLRTLAGHGSWNALTKAFRL